GDGEDLQIGHALHFAKTLCMSSLPVDYALVLRTNPKIAFIPSQLSNIQRRKSRMKHCEPLAVKSQYSALARPDQQLPRTQRQDPGNGPGIGLCGKNLTEVRSVEGQNPFRCGHNQQLRLFRVAQNASCQA